MSELTKIETILVATDFSETAEKAVTWAAQIARSHGARLVVYHGVRPPVPPLVSPTPEILSNESHEIEREYALERLEKAADSIRVDGVEVEIDVQIDLGAQTILQRAAAHGADLIVAGTRGMIRLKKVLLGSTATRLIRDAAVPVVTVPPLAAKARPIRRILVPTDFATDLQGTVESIEHLLGSEAPETDATLLHVHEAPYQPASPWAAPLVLGPRSATAASAVRRLERTAQRLEHHLHGIETVACGGDPARAIDREAQHLEADLIVMGHGRSALSRLFRTSTAERVLAASPCPVLTIRKGTRAVERAEARAQTTAAHASAVQAGSGF